MPSKFFRAHFRFVIEKDGAMSLEWGLGWFWIFVLSALIVWRFG